jgi:hypothetical protein
LRQCKNSSHWPTREPVFITHFFKMVGQKNLKLNTKISLIKCLILKDLTMCKTISIHALILKIVLYRKREHIVSHSNGKEATSILYIAYLSSLLSLRMINLSLKWLVYLLLIITQEIWQVNQTSCKIWGSIRYKIYCIFQILISFFNSWSSNSYSFYLLR